MTNYEITCERPGRGGVTRVVEKRSRRLAEPVGGVRKGERRNATGRQALGSFRGPYGRFAQSFPQRLGWSPTKSPCSNRNNAYRRRLLCRRRR